MIRCYVITLSSLACEQALHLGNIMKSGRARGDAGAGERKESSPFLCPPRLRGSLRLPK